MSDLISRDALIKELEEWYDRVGDDSLQDRLVQSIISFAMDDVNDAEAVDAVEVVRCKDCKERTQSCGMVLHCRLNGIQTDDDDFCSYGTKG